jgi:hypothetical protein
MSARSDVPTTIDYAARERRSWLRRHRRMLAIVAAAIVLAVIARPAFVWVERWVQWQLAWRDLAAEADRQPVDAPLEEQLKAAPYPTVIGLPPATQPADAARRLRAVARLRPLDRGLADADFAVPVGWGKGDVRVFRMTRPDGVRRLVLMHPPDHILRAFAGISVAVCREPTWLDASFDRTIHVLPAGMSGNGPGEIGVHCELRLDDQTPPRLIARVAYRDGVESSRGVAYEGRLTNEDRLRWRLIESTLATDRGVQVRLGPPLEFEDAVGRLVEYDNGGSPIVPIKRMLHPGDAKGGAR